MALPRHLTLSLMVISSTQLGQSSPGELPVNAVHRLQCERYRHVDPHPPPQKKGPFVASVTYKYTAVTWQTLARFKKHGVTATLDSVE